MAVKFGNDGTLYCNTVKYKYKQCRNLLADGCGLGSGYYQDFSNISYSTVGNGYAQSSYQFGTGFCMYSQPMPTPIAGHKYYGACYWKTPAGWTGGDTRFEWFIGDADTKKITFFSKGDTGGQWQKLSAIGSMASVDAGSYILRNFATGSTGTAYCTNMMIVDLTDTFGAGNEPSKEWCDENIREWNTLVNYGTILPTTTTSSNKLTNSGLEALHLHNYGSLDDGVFPRDYMYNAVVNSAASECYLMGAGLSLTQGQTYYGAFEGRLQSGAISSFDLYLPIAEPNMGSVAFVNESSYNGGGSMSGWKRISFFSVRNNWASGSYDSRWDINNVYNSANVYSFAHQLVRVDENINAYNSIYGTKISLSDVNREWCDRWICNKGHSIIHIGDPAFKKVQFNTNYDVVCNDIEIRPEVNKISFTSNGKIICKKLVRTQTY